MSLSLLPENALVGLITFGTMVGHPQKEIIVVFAANIFWYHIDSGS